MGGIAKLETVLLSLKNCIFRKIVSFLFPTLSVKFVQLNWACVTECLNVQESKSYYGLCVLLQLLLIVVSVSFLQQVWQKALRTETHRVLFIMLTCASLCSLSSHEPKIIPHHGGSCSALKCKSGWWGATGKKAFGRAFAIKHMHILYGRILSNGMTCNYTTKTKHSAALAPPPLYLFLSSLSYIQEELRTENKTRESEAKRHNEKHPWISKKSQRLGLAFH